MSGYPYVDFSKSKTSIQCDNINITIICPYLAFLRKEGYTDYQLDRVGSISINPENFCASCAWNRAR